MRHFLPLLIAVLVGTNVVPAHADGPLARSITREAGRLAAVPQAPAEKTSGTVELRWTELSPVVVGQRVTVRLADGTSARGEVLVVRETGLVVASPRAAGAMPRGEGGMEVPREQIRTIELRKTTGRWGRKLGTSIGMLCGVVIGGYVAGTTADSAGPGIATFLTLASGMTVAGYYAGRQLDTQVTVIRVAG